MVFREIITPALYTAGRALFHFNLVILDFNIVILVQNDYIESPDDAIEFSSHNKKELLPQLLLRIPPPPGYPRGLVSITS